QPAIRFTRIVQREDVRMGERRGDSYFAPESLGGGRRRTFGRHDLHSDLATVPDIIGKVYDAHAPAAQLTLGDIALAEHESQLVENGKGRHRRHKDVSLTPNARAALGGFCAD